VRCTNEAHVPQLRKAAKGNLMDTSPLRDTALEESDEPLPLTLRFVFVLGGLIVVGWFLMFFLLQERW